jgi:hypothetical protein
MKILLTLFLILSGSLQFSANQPNADVATETEVEEVVINFFEAMRESDSAGMQSILTVDATLQTVAISEQESTVLNKTDIQSFLSSVGESVPGALDEQITSFTAHVDGKLSTAWMEYRFYYDGEFSHCGVNTMNLIHTETGWKIFSIVDTRRQDPC